MRILLTDDSVEFLKAAAGFLSGEPGVEIVGRALSGREALEQAARLRPDLVLMDLVMPGVNGLEATQQIKALPGAPRVVILTLHNGPEYRAAAEAAGADGFIPKSEFSAKLLPLIRALNGEPS